MEFRKDQVAELDNGARVKMVRKTGQGNVKCEVLEDSAPYHKGQFVFVTCDELRERTATQTELLSNYEHAIDYATRSLHRMVETGLQARQEVVNRILAGGVEALTSHVKWGHGVEEELMMGKAMHVELMVSEGHSLQRALEAVRDQCEAELLGNSHRGGSTNDYSNAVDATRRIVAERFAARASTLLDLIVDARAKAEVL